LAQRSLSDTALAEEDGVLATLAEDAEQRDDLGLAPCEEVRGVDRGPGSEGAGHLRDALELLLRRVHVACRNLHRAAQFVYCGMAFVY
jgi:hypothetical protein